MTNSFLHTIHKPAIVLAPMADVTDPAFRSIIAKYGKPDAMWTEFVSADGLYHTREIQKIPDAENPLMHALRFGKNEHPIVAQFFGAHPETIQYAARLAVTLGFDAVDINMGCPDRTIERQGAGAALIKYPTLARALIRAARRGVGGAVPVTVKTRIGYNKNELDSWLPELLAETPDLITIHARTRKEMSLVDAHWDAVAQAVKIRDTLKSNTYIFGNGDVKTVNDARKKAKQVGADGVMIGRGVFGNPWLWSGRSWDTISLEEKKAVLLEHCRAFDILCQHKHFMVMKKHFKAYIHGFPGATQLRAQLMATNSTEEVAHILNSYTPYV